MKVRITFDITDDQRVAISVYQGNGFRPATREEIVEFVDGIVSGRIDDLGTNYREAMDEVVSRLKANQLTK